MTTNIFDRVKLLFRKDKDFHAALYRILGFYPKNVELYRIAFAHKSHEYRNSKGRSLNNERLEFLGDAVLDSVVADILFHHFERKREGFLTATRSKIVQRESLNRLAKELGLDHLLQSTAKQNAHNSYLGGNAFEALVGAIYLDRGYKYCQYFVRKRIIGKLMDLDATAHKEVNFKSKLLEWSQKNKIRNEFRMSGACEGNSPTPTFECTVFIEGIRAGSGTGYSKKESQQNAARDALTHLRRDRKFHDSLFLAKEKRTAMEANEVVVLPIIDEIEEELRRTPAPEAAPAGESRGRSRRNSAANKGEQNAAKPDKSAAPADKKPQSAEPKAAAPAKKAPKAEKPAGQAADGAPQAEKPAARPRKAAKEAAKEGKEPAATAREAVDTKADAPQPQKAAPVQSDAAAAPADSPAPDATDAAGKAPRASRRVRGRKKSSQLPDEQAEAARKQQAEDIISAALEAAYGE